MASVYSATPFLLSLPRWLSDVTLACPSGLVGFPRLRYKWGLSAMWKEKMGKSLDKELCSNEDSNLGKRTPRTRTRKAPAKTRKKAIPVITHDNPESSAYQPASSEVSKKTRGRPKKKAASSADNGKEEVREEDRIEKRGRRRAKKMADDIHSAGDKEHQNRKGIAPSRNLENESEESVELGKEEDIQMGRERREQTKEMGDMEQLSHEREFGYHGSFAFTANMEAVNEEELELGKHEEEDISFTYGWPPLVCCFGAAKHAFVPSGRQANRLVDYEMQEIMKDALWTPEKFVRAPGGSSGFVAVALAHLGGKVAFMGKLGNDVFGQSLLYYMNAHNVQTRSVRVDSELETAVSRMKINSNGGLKMTCVRPSAEDSLLKSEINIDVLKEAKMFYFNTSSLIDQCMRLTALQAIKISKKFGSVIFYDLNLPLPLWQSLEETKMVIRQVWNLADFIEVTKQELEFLCGIRPFENFDTQDNDRLKFAHYEPEVVAPLWHENLKVLFVTNGTSKVHYYTKEHNNAILGMEEPPSSPYTSDMSASGDGIVAGLMRMLTVQPHLSTDKEYLEHSIKYAIRSGIIDQWLLARRRGFPPREGMEEEFVPDLNGIRSVTEKEFRTLRSVN